MDQQPQGVTPTRSALCQNWTYGFCCQGDSCNNDHPKNLDPTMTSRKEIDYQVSNELGEACRRCLHVAIKCDKKGRDPGPNDPCSECRLFGGANCNCSLSLTSSYNDALLRCMMVRRDSDFDLAQPKDKQAALSNGRVPTAMPDDKLKNDWQGASKDELLARDNMLPPEVRRHPRAYLVPPRESNTKKKTTAYLASRGSRPSAQRVSPSSSNTRMAPVQYAGVQHQPPPRPLAYPQGNAVVASAMHWPTGQQVQHYQSGHTVISPRQSMFPFLQNTSSTPAYGTNSTWNIQPPNQPPNQPPRLPQVPMSAMRPTNEPSMANVTTPPPMPDVRAANERPRSDTAERPPAKRQRTMSTAAQASSTHSQANEEQDKSKLSTTGAPDEPPNHDDSDEEYFSAPE